MALVTFGLLSDIQYADIENGTSFYGQVRHYRNALVCLKEALDTWEKHNKTHNAPNNQISFILNLGDTIDGRNKEKSEAAVDRVLDHFSTHFPGPIYHLIGNHCLYHLQRSSLHPKLSKSRTTNDDVVTSTSSDDVTASSDVLHHYFEFSPHPKVRFINLDSFDISVLGWPENHPHVKIAQEILNKNNPNKDQNSYSGLSGDKMRFVAFNGGVGPAQLKWLKEMLDLSLSMNQIVIINSHVPLVQLSPYNPAFLWNYDEVLSLLDQYSNIVCCFAGHEHDGGYLCRKKVHHFVMPAIVECQPGSNAFATVEIFNDKIKINGFGIVESTKLPIKFP